MLQIFVVCAVFLIYIFLPWIVIGVKQFTTPSKINSTFMNDLKINSASVREKNIQEQVVKWTVRIPKIMRTEAAKGRFQCMIQISCDYDIKREVVRRLHEWAEKNGLNPDAPHGDGFFVNWN